MKYNEPGVMYYCWKSITRLVRGSAYQYSIVTLILGSLAEYYLIRNEHGKVRWLGEKLIKKKILIGYYYKALSFFLFAEYQKAENCIKSIPDYHNNPEVVYLYAEILTRQQRIEETWKILERVSVNNSRKKVWHIMSDLVNNKNDLDRFHKNVLIVRENTPFLNGDKLETEFINAYMRAGLECRALEVAESNKESIRQQNQATKKKFMDKKKANNALQDFKFFCNKFQIEFFLISGTLLGCIRENDFLAYDKDIDIGVWDSHSHTELLEIISQSGCFYIIKSRAKNVVKLRHVNGTDIDVFIHHKEGEYYWHSSTKLKWCNTIFDLVYTKFLGTEYLIPANFDLYLSENYGNDWRIPKQVFDSTYDTPNAQVANECEYELYKYRY